MTDAAIPAITIWQPWASLIAAGAKRFEFRSWAPPACHQRRRIAIHAGARKASLSETRDLLLTLRSSYWRDTALEREPAIALLAQVQHDLANLPYRAALCTAMLGKPIRNADLERALGIPVVNDSDRMEHTNWAWPLSDIRLLEPPLPALGKQGFFSVFVPPDHAA